MDLITSRLDWKGADSGNEWVFNPDDFFSMLALIDEHAPADHTNVDSPFAVAANHRFSQQVVYKRNDGTTSGVFRRGHPWAHLNLVRKTNHGLELTDVGKRVLTTPSLRSELLLPTLLSIHKEPEKNPYVVISAAVWESPKQSLNIRDVVDKVAPFYLPGVTPLKDVLDSSPRKSNDRYRRGIRSYLKILNLLNICVIRGNKIILNDRGSIQYFLSVAGVSISPNVDIISENHVANHSSQSKQLSYRGLDTRAERIKLENFVWDYRDSDPQVRHDKLERATREHEKTVVSCAKLLESLGAKCFESQESFDLFASHSSESWLFEIKTITKNNINSQLRSALSQLLTYKFRWACKTEDNPGISANSNLAIVTDKNPAPLLQSWWLDLLKWQNIMLYSIHDGRFREAGNGTLPFDQA